MSKFIGMIKNENMKIYRRPRTWIMIGIIVAFIGFMAFVMSSFGGGMLTAEATVLDLMLMSASFISFVAIFSVIVAGDIVSSEFGWGTIKLLLIRPINRSKVLLAKYIAVILFSILLLVALFLASLLFGLIFFGWGESTISFIDILVEYAYGIPELIITFTIAFMISAVFRSSALAIGLSIFLMTVGVNLIVMLLSRYDWAKYILYLNTDLVQYREGMQPYIEGMTMGFSITMLVLYYVLFMGLSWFFFNKRDVTN